MQLDQHAHGISSDEDVGAYSYVSYVLTRMIPLTFGALFINCSFIGVQCGGGIRSTDPNHSVFFLIRMPYS